MKYHTTHTIEPTFDGEYGVVVEWRDKDGSLVCGGSAVVSRDPENYVPILAADIRKIYEELFQTNEAEGGIIDEV